MSAPHDGDISGPPAEGGPIQLDLRGILRARSGAARRVPGFVFGWLERLIRQDELNAMLRGAWPRRGSAFARAVMDHLRIRVETQGLEGIPEGEPLVFASNHPLGGLDGIALIAVLGERYGDGHLRFLVNDMLMNVEPLSDVFLPVNKYGRQGREAAVAIARAFRDPTIQIAVFPAGLVSRLGDDGRVADLEWQKAFAAKAIDSRRRVVPVRVEALNRPGFYRLARLRKRLGVKVNLEQALLPAEMCARHDSRIRIVFGTPVSPEGHTPASLSDAVRRQVYP